MELTGATCLKARLRHTLKGAGMLVHIGEFLQAVTESVRRRENLMRAAKKISCPKCRSEQIQLLHNKGIAKWKCRECKIYWTHEPITLIRSDSN